MTETVTIGSSVHHDHMTWVRTRMALDSELREENRQGFSLITVGFGSFAFLEGIINALGEGEGADISKPSRAFSLIATAIGVILMAIALNHYRKMIAFVNADTFGRDTVLTIPNEKRLEIISLAGILLGIVSFCALLVLR